MRYVSKNNLLFLLAVTLFLFHSGYLYNFTVDDAYISFRYADNLAQGKGMVFNVGERQEGYSNFLWVTLLGFFSWLGISPIISSKLLSVLSAIGIFVLTLKLSQLFKKTYTPFNFISLFLIASNTSLVIWVASGLETIFYTFLLLLASYLFLNECKGKGTYASAFCFLLLALTRPEGILFFFLPVLFRLLDVIDADSQFSWKSFFIYALIFFLPLSAYVVWKYLYFGVVIPNTFYAKFRDPLRLTYQTAGKFRKAFHYLTQAFLNNNLVVTIPFLGILFGNESLGKGQRKLIYIIGVIFVQIAFIVSVGGDWMPRARFIVPVLPFIYLLFQEGMRCSVAKIRSRLFEYSLILTVCILCIANFPSSKFEHQEYLKKRDGELKRIKEFGMWLKQSFPSHYTVAYEEAGIPMYYSQLRLLDVLGLINRDIAKIWYTFPHDYWEVNRGVVDYVLGKKPELIVVVSKRNPKELKDFYSGVAYTFYYNDNFQMNYKLIQIRDWVLLHERELWPEGLSLSVYLRKDLKHLHKGLT